MEKDQPWQALSCWRIDARNSENISKDDEGFFDSYNLSVHDSLSQSPPVFLMPTAGGSSSSKSKVSMTSRMLLKRSMFEDSDLASSEEELSSSNSKIPFKKKKRNPSMRDSFQETARSSLDHLMSFGTPTPKHREAITKNFDIKVVQRENFDQYPNASKQLRSIMKKKHLDDGTDKLGEDNACYKKKEPSRNSWTHFKPKKVTSEKRIFKPKSSFSNKTSKSKLVDHLNYRTSREGPNHGDKKILVPNNDYSIDFPENSVDYVVTVPQPFKFGEIINEFIGDGAEATNENGADVYAAVTPVTSEVDDLLSTKCTNNNLEEVIDDFVSSIQSPNQIKDRSEDDVTPTPCLDNNQKVHQEEIDDIFKQMEAMHAESEPVANPDREFDLMMK